MKRMLWLGVLLLLTGCSGLPKPREMGDMALLRTMAVDGAPEGVMVTAATGGGGKERQGEDEALVLTARSASLSGASLAMQKQGEDHAFFGYVDQLLVGEDLARQGLRSILNYFVRGQELGPGARIWIVGGTTAEQAVRSGGAEDVEERLSTLCTDGALGVAALSRSVGEIYTDLLELGSACLPALGADEEAALSELGYAVLKTDRLVGYLSGEAAKGLELLLGKPRQDILELEVDGRPVAVWIREAETEQTLRFENGAPARLEVVCRVEAGAVEYSSDLPAGWRERLTDQVEERLQRRGHEALTQLQTWGADCVALGAKAGMKCPGRWRQLEENWPEIFAGLESRVRVEVDLSGPHFDGRNREEG